MQHHNVIIIITDFQFEISCGGNTGLVSCNYFRGGGRGCGSDLDGMATIIFPMVSLHKYSRDKAFEL